LYSKKRWYSTSSFKCVLQQKTVLGVQVNNKNERGLLGIAILKNSSSSSTTNAPPKATVFLYFTEASNDGKLIGNRVYRYEWNGEALINPSLILDLPAKLAYHNSS
jgi:aldose sugar dehydrogenase